jgi:hypothetical protein
MSNYTMAVTTICAEMLEAGDSSGNQRKGTSTVEAATEQHLLKIVKD